MTHRFYYRKRGHLLCLGLLSGMMIFLFFMGFLPLWSIGVVALLVGLYAGMICRAGIVITDRDIRIDFSAPLAWTDVRTGEIKTVVLCGRPKKILSLQTDKNLNYPYSFLQRHNGAFGAFPIPLYGLLSSADEKAIIDLVSRYVAVKGK